MMTDTKTGRELVVTRLIDAPRELVFAAFTEQQHAEKWWIPNGTTHEWNAEPGGFWRYSMPSQDGGQHNFRVQFIEIDKPNRFVYDHGTDSEEAPEPVRTTVTFQEQNGKTRVTLRLRFATTAAREEAEKYGAAAGAQMALKNLAEYLVLV
jgi:uncharacterized protein YndB with AHSA1/START domain